MLDFWVILSAILVACCCSILGCFLILRRMAMLTDAISHAVLPGIVLAYLFSGQKNTVILLVGAGIVGVLATFLIELLHRKLQLQTDSSTGLVFTFLFAVGVILISVFADQIDLDQECVLYGEILYVPLDTLMIGNFEIPRALVILVPLLILILTIIYVFYKQFLLTSFDENYAISMGVSTMLWHYVLMSMVSVVTVASFELVGSILVVAFFVLPPVTAYLMSRDLIKMIMLSCVIGTIDAIGGYYLSDWLDGSPTGAMVVFGGVVFALVLIIEKVRNRAKKLSII
jgi:manganese/zinc/iron transport system permease protein